MPVKRTLRLSFYYGNKRIFMPEGIRTEFRSLLDLLRAAQVERKLQYNTPAFIEINGAET